MVDTLTAKDDEGNRFAKLRVRDVRICKIPVSEASRGGVHPSTFGEWYFSIAGGTENSALGCSVIENHLSSNKVIRRAISGGGLPVVSQFYEEFGRVKCFGTNKTFDEVRAFLDDNAISRAQFARYRFVMQRLYRLAQLIMTRADVLTDTEIIGCWGNTKKRIENGVVK